MGVWSNWSGSVQCRPARTRRAETQREVVGLIARAEREGQPVRVVGSGHSGTALAETDGLLLSVDGLSGIESWDRETLRATIGAGSKLCDLGDPLLERGMSMENLGDIDLQTLAGAIGTGTHGTGRSLGNLSTQVDALRFVDARGAVIEVCGESDPEDLRGLRVSLGALGVVTAIRLRLAPAYRLHERIWRASIEECLDQLEERIRDNRHFEFFWLPQKDLAELKTLNPTDAPVDALPDRPYERIGWSPHILPSQRDEKFFEMEYAIPAEYGPECFREVRTRMQERHPQVVWPVEYRTLAADDAYLSPAFGRETVTLSIHQDGALAYRDFFQDVEPIFWAFGGRPHWGKIHTRRASELCDLYPEWQRFQSLRERLDPSGLFMNAHLAALFL